MESREKLAAKTCECGCGEPTKGGNFLPGHDQRLRISLEKRAGGLLALRELVDSVENSTRDRPEHDLDTRTAIQRIAASKADRVKEEIGWLKVVFAILAAIDISLIGWLAQGYSSAPAFLQAVAFVAVGIVTGGIVRVSGAARRKIAELEDL